MKPERYAAIALLALMLTASGCASIGSKLSSLFESKPEAKPQGKSKYTIKFPDQERTFAAALEFLKKGNEKKAREMLEIVSDSPPLNGVTDEALFRLAILHLGDEGGKGVGRAQTLLERLRSEFPGSIWTSQAAPLSTYLSGAKSLRDREREVKILRELNLSLSRDNKELRQSIERIKNLDLELERKNRR